MRYFFLFFTLLSVNGPAFGQRDSSIFFRISVDNDAFVPTNNATDWGYTNGIRVGVFYQSPLNKTFLEWANRKLGEATVNTRSWSLMQHIIAPQKTSLTVPDKSDYPYAGALVGIHSIHTSQTARMINIQTEWSLGMLGPPSLAGPVHRFFHRLIKDPIPKGWDHQLPADFLLNHDIEIEKSLSANRRDRQFPNFMGRAKARIGTMHDDLLIGIKTFAGDANRYFAGLLRQTFSDRFRIMAWMDAALRYNFYNALLQGGLFNGKSPLYNRNAISGTDLKLRRLSLGLEFTIWLMIKNLSASFSQKYTSTELSGFDPHLIGNLSLSIKL